MSLEAWGDEPPYGCERCGDLESDIEALREQLAEANRKLELWEWSVENCYVYRDHEDLYFASSFDWERATACFNSPVEAIAALKAKVEGDK